MENLFCSDPWFPSRRSHYQRATPQPTYPFLKSKVISIPVTDGSKKLDRPSAAVKIQKAVRGFLVRAAMRTLHKIATEVEEVGQHISPEKVCSNAKERLRIGEMLMALLLRLDSVRGVRDYRKKLIRRVIHLQEALDDITLPASPTAAETIEQKAIQQEHGRIEDDTPIAAVESQQIEDLMIEEAVKDSDEIVGQKIQQEGNRIPETMEEPPRKTESEMAGLKEVMEKNAVENETLKKLVGELCERSAQQCELMSGLVQRVQQLERRFHGMGRRKKRGYANHSNKQYAM